MATQGAEFLDGANKGRRAQGPSVGKPPGGYGAWTCPKADVPSMREYIAGPMTEVKLAKASRRSRWSRPAVAFGTSCSGQQTLWLPSTVS